MNSSDFYKPVKLRSLGQFTLNKEYSNVRVRENFECIDGYEVEVLVGLLMINDETEEQNEMLLLTLDIKNIGNEFAELYITTGNEYVHTSMIKSFTVNGNIYTFSTQNSTYSFNLLATKLSEPNVKNYLKGKGQLIEIVP